MRNKSHAAMGRCLLRRFMSQLPMRYARMFLLGCTQPDKNPATYLKGSLRTQWMRGHNYGNAHRYMVRLANRLENREQFSYWDFYSLGKLIHYTMDAFTYAHNEHFPKGLRSHRQYETALQIFFLARLRRFRMPDEIFSGSAAELIRKEHAQYMQQPGGMETDTAYAVAACFGLMQLYADKVRRPNVNNHHL